MSQSESLVPLDGKSKLIFESIHNAPHGHTSAIREKKPRGNTTRDSLKTRQLRVNSEISQKRTDSSQFETNL
jgi:hypothetical protein